jgi:SNF2 family DNA or RNA helicase
MGGYMGKEVVGVKDVEGLAKIVDPFIFHATKEEWAKTLPEKSFSVLPVAMNTIQLDVYRQIKEDFIASLPDDEADVTADAAIAVYQKLIQISTGFVINDDQKTIILGKTNLKLDAMVYKVLAFGGKQKAVVVCVNRFALELAATALENAKLTYVMIRGGEDIEAAKQAFNTTDVDVCLLGVQAGSVGLTLLGTKDKPCSTMIFLQNAWSSYLRIQTIDRIHRFGQNFACNYIDIVASPIDRAILGALHGKRTVVEAVLGALKESNNNAF